MLTSVIINSGGNGNILNIEEKILGAEQKRKWTNHAEILEGSSLAAYYLKTEPDTKHYRVIFQGKEGNRLFDADRDAGCKFSWGSVSESQC
jgi:hypothetical protein